jgi:hypothetical protein
MDTANGAFGGTERGSILRVEYSVSLTIAKLILRVVLHEFL